MSNETSNEATKAPSEMDKLKASLRKYYMGAIQRIAREDLKLYGMDGMRLTREQLEQYQTAYADLLAHRMREFGFACAESKLFSVEGTNDPTTGDVDLRVEAYVIPASKIDDVLVQLRAIAYDEFVRNEEERKPIMDKLLVLEFLEFLDLFERRAENKRVSPKEEGDWPYSPVAQADRRKPRREMSNDTKGTHERCQEAWDNFLNQLLGVTQMRGSIGNYDVPVVHLNYMHLMKAGDPFVASFSFSQFGVDFSLHSAEGGVDVGEIAKMYGGDGHKYAARFRLSFREFATWCKSTSGVGDQT